MEFKEFFSLDELDKEPEQTIVNLYIQQPAMPISSIAQTTQRSMAEVYRILHSYGIKPNRLYCGHDVVNSCAEGGYDINRIAAISGYTPRNIRYILAKNRKEG